MQKKVYSNPQISAFVVPATNICAVSQLEGTVVGGGGGSTEAPARALLIKK